MDWTRGWRQLNSLDLLTRTGLKWVSCSRSLDPPAGAQNPREWWCEMCNALGMTP